MSTFAWALHRRACRQVAGCFRFTGSTSGGAGSWLPSELWRANLGKLPTGFGPTKGGTEVKADSPTIFAISPEILFSGFSSRDCSECGFCVFQQQLKLSLQDSALSEDPSGRSHAVVFAQRHQPGSAPVPALNWDLLHRDIYDVTFG